MNYFNSHSCSSTAAWITFQIKAGCQLEERLLFSQHCKIHAGQGNWNEI